MRLSDELFVAILETLIFTYVEYMGKKVYIENKQIFLFTTNIDLIEFVGRSKPLHIKCYDAYTNDKLASTYFKRSYKLKLSLLQARVSRKLLLEKNRLPREGEIWFLGRHYLLLGPLTGLHRLKCEISLKQ